MGIKDVTGMGIGSKIHQVAQMMVMAAVQHALASQPATDRLRKAVAASRGPSNRARKWVREATI